MRVFEFGRRRRQQVVVVFVIVMPVDVLLLLGGRISLSLILPVLLTCLPGPLTCMNYHNHRERPH